jgi:hypothetical protein
VTVRVPESALRAAASGTSIRMAIVQRREISIKSGVLKIQILPRLPNSFDAFRRCLLPEQGGFHVHNRPALLDELRQKLLDAPCCCWPALQPEQRGFGLPEAYRERRESMTAIVLAVIPYAILRGPVNRLMQMSRTRRSVVP